MKINLRESLNKIDLVTDNKYDLLNTFNSKKLSDNSKKKLAEALNKNASAKTISRMLNESYDKYDYLKESLSEDFSEAEIKAVNDWNNRKRRKYGYKYYPEKYYGNFDIYVNGYELYYPEDIDYSDSLADTVAYLKSKIKSGEIKSAIITDADIYYPQTDEHVELWRSDNRFGEENYGYNPNIIRFYKNAKYTEALDKEQLYKVIIKNGPNELNFESNLSYEDAQEIVDYYNGRWIDENGFEWDMYVEEDDESTEHTEVDEEPSFESLNEADYGGAYDIENDMFFTKEDIVEFAEEVCEYLGDIFGYQYDINNVYMDGPRKLYINIYDNNYIEVESTFNIDMRKIRKPSDLSKVYGLNVENWFQKAFAREYRDAGLDESLNESNKSVIIGTMTLDHEIPNWTNYAESPKYDENVTALPSTSSVTIYPYNSKELGHSAYWGFKAIDADGNKDFARMNTYIYALGKYLDGYKGMTLKLNSNWEWSDKYPYLIFKGKNMFEDLTEDTVKTKSGKWVNKGDTGKTHGEFKTKKEADAQRKAMYARGFKGESLKEDIEEYSEEDFDIDYDEADVESGNFFFADGKNYVWEERIAGPTYLDFDKWAVWSAREITPLQDFIIGKNEQGGYDVDEDAYIAAINSKSSVYFVVEEDTGFIDWGPVETSTEAQDFLNSKEEDFWNDEEIEEIEVEEESLTESRAIRNDGDYEVTLHYDDIGNGKEYDYTLGYDEVVDYLKELAWSNGDGPEDLNEDEYLEWVMDNFDELADKYELNVLDYFEDEASQHEYDHRYDEP